MRASARHLISIADLADEEVDAILTRADSFATGENPPPRSFVGALLFLSSSLRTRLGFGTAIGRLGGSLVDVSEMRWDPNMSAAESLADAFRTVTGMVDLTIARAPVRLAELAHQHAGSSSIICGGDLAEHPTQALIDMYAIERLRGPVRDLRVGLVGDMTMRASRSLLRLFNRRPPRGLVIISPPARGIDIPLSPQLARRTTVGTLDDLASIDVVSMCGLPPGQGDQYLDEASRVPWSLTAHRLAMLPDDAVVLSPMPVIDEIAPDARHDGRIRMFDQSDLSVAVRMAVVELALS